MSLQTLTVEGAPPAPPMLIQPPPLDPAILKLQSTMIPPPPTMPEIQNKLYDAIKSLYKSKVLKPPQNMPVMPAIPAEAPVPTFTMPDAPAPPQGIPLPPPLDPAIIRKSAIMVPPPPTIPELREKI